MSRVFLTGATGMIGSNIAEQLVDQGDTVRALVRAGSETGPLEAFGVEVVRGDITDPDAVLAAADGCEYVIHSAAVLGGQTQIAGEHEAVNVVGTGHVLDAAAKVAATRKGVAGERYLAFGQPGDVGGVPYFCNTALEIAGSPNRVTEVAVAELDDPDVAARFGPSLVALARKRFPSPFFVNDQTVERLGYQPLSLRDALARTIPWMREHGLL